MLGAFDGVATDTNSSRLAKADVSSLFHGFVSQRTRARHNTNRPTFVDVAGHNADFAGVRCNHTGAVWSDQARCRPFQSALYLHHVQHRNAFGDADDQFHVRIDRFQDRVSREGRRNIDHRGVCFGFRFCFVDRVEHGQAKVVNAAFTRCYAANHFGAVCDCLFGVESTLRAGEALTDHFGVFVDEDSHLAVSLIQKEVKKKPAGFFPFAAAF